MHNLGLQIGDENKPYYCTIFTMLTFPGTLPQMYI